MNRIVITLVVGAIVCLGAAAFAPSAWAAELAPASPQPSALEPGLRVHYHYGEFGHVDELLKLAASESPAVGEPLANLDFRGGTGKKVFGTKFLNLVGAIITGYIRFPEARGYALRVRSNDGVRLTIGGQMLHEDPGKHADRTSDPLRVNIREPGWYPIEVVWYEIRHSYALELTWSAGGGFVAVPPEHFGH